MSDQVRRPYPGRIARQQKQILAELGGLRDEMAVITSIALRLDGILTALLGEFRTMH